MKKFFAVLLLVSTFFLNTAHKAEALSCAAPQTVTKEMEQSSIVFKGEAIDIMKNGVTVFQVDQAWKGVTKSIVQMYDNGWDPYTKGAVYLVFGNQRDGELRTNLCGNTGTWDNARENAMKETNIKSTKFVKELPPLDMERSPIGIVILTVFIAFLFLLIIAVWRRKKRNV